jgi:hypothetical protein
MKKETYLPCSVTCHGTPEHYFVFVVVVRTPARGNDSGVSIAVWLGLWSHGKMATSGGKRRKLR